MAYNETLSLMKGIIVNEKWTTEEVTAYNQEVENVVSGMKVLRWIAIGLWSVVATFLALIITVIVK